MEERSRRCLEDNSKMYPREIWRKVRTEMKLLRVECDSRFFFFLTFLIPWSVE
jgi:hypothetical protein